MSAKMVADWLSLLSVQLTLPGKVNRSARIEHIRRDYVQKTSYLINIAKAHDIYIGFLNKKLR